LIVVAGYVTEAGNYALKITIHDLIPAVSDWDLVVMTLLAVTVGILVYVWQRPAARGGWVVVETFGAWRQA
jgi:hypothetical protein